MKLKKLKRKDLLELMLKLRLKSIKLKLLVVSLLNKKQLKKQ